MLSKSLRERLVCAKYLFRQGQSLLQSGKPFSSGLAVLTFQDAAEMVLRVIAENHHVPLKPNVAFNQLIDDIDKVGAGVLSHRSALNQLNKARINFKHFGLEPKATDAAKFEVDLQGFFSSSFPVFLQVSFDEVSLVDLVRHQRTANWLKKAEKSLAEDDHGEAALRASIAFTIFQSSVLRDEKSIRLSGSIGRPESIRQKQKNTEDSVLNQVYTLAKAVEEKLEQHRKQLEILTDGISLAAYRRFSRLAPAVRLTARNTTIWAERRSRIVGHTDFTYDEAHFCFSFALDAVLRMQERRIPPRFQPAPSGRRFKVVSKTNVVIPAKMEEDEVIREAEPGEVLEGHYESSDRAGYAAIVQDGDLAYVPQKAVELLSE